MSVIRVALFWVNRNIELKFVLISPVMDPITVLVIFGILIMVYVICLRGIRNSNIKMFIPFFMSIPVTTSALLGFAAYGFYYDAWCLSWLSSWECITYPGCSITWSVLNLYLLMLTLHHFKAINQNSKQNTYPQHDVEGIAYQNSSTSKRMKIMKINSIILPKDDEKRYLKENFKSRNII